MATSKQSQAAKRNVKKAQKAATSKKTIANLPAKTRAELYEIAKKRDLPGRSKMGRDELARKLGEK